MTASILGGLTAIGTALGFVLFAASCLKAADNLSRGRDTRNGGGKK